MPVPRNTHMADELCNRDGDGAYSRPWNSPLRLGLPPGAVRTSSHAPHVRLTNRGTVGGKVPSRKVQDIAVLEEALILGPRLQKFRDQPDLTEFKSPAHLQPFCMHCKTARHALCFGGGVGRQ
jgi:hypothetical protein